jgi:hypothetical protein
MLAAPDPSEINSIRFDHLLIHNYLGYSAQIPSLASSLYYIANNGSNAIPVQIETIDSSVSFQTESYHVSVMIDGLISITDRRNTLFDNNTLVNSVGYFYDHDQPIVNLIFRPETDNTNIFQFSAECNNKSYTIIMKLLNEGVIFNIYSTTPFFPAIKMRPSTPTLPGSSTPMELYMYGLGEELHAGNLYIDQGFSNTIFGTGIGSKEIADTDKFRLRTPILVSPQSLTGYALFDDKVKHIAYDHTGVFMGVSRIDKFNNPAFPNNTVINQQQQVYSFERGFAVFTGRNPEDLYRHFHAIRKGFQYPVYTPKYDHYGVSYELFGDWGCNGDGSRIIQRVDEITSKLGIQPDFVVIGSGYWTGRNLLGCPPTEGYDKIHDTTTDSFAIREDRYPASFFTLLHTRGIKVLIGMRTNLSTLKYIDNSAGILSSTSDPLLEALEVILKSMGISADNSGYIINPHVLEAFGNDCLLRNPDGSILHTIFGGVGTHLVVLDALKPYARRWFLNKVKLYDDQNDPPVWKISGFKDDTMLPAFQGYGQYLTENKTYLMLADFAANGYMQRSRNDFFTLTSDIQIVPGYQTGVNPERPFSITNVFDKVLQLSQHHAFSGYYTPGYEIGPSVGFPIENAIRESHILLLLRAIQFSAFFPNLNLSKPLWTISDDLNHPTTTTLKYFAHLHKRMQNYIYDLAVDSFNSGVPFAHMPLVIEYPDDVNVYNLGRAFVSHPQESASDQSNAEFMLGRALIVAPITVSGNSRVVYLPEGKWHDMFTGEIYQGGNSYTYTMGSVSENNLFRYYPVFVRAGEPFILKNTLDDPWENRVRIYPESNYFTVYNHYDHMPELSDLPKIISGTITVDTRGKTWDTEWDIDKIEVIDRNTNSRIPVEKSTIGELMFNMEDGKSYIVTSTI